MDFYTYHTLWTAHFYHGLVQWSAWIMHIKSQVYDSKGHPGGIFPIAGQRHCWRKSSRCGPVTKAMIFKLLNHNSLSSSKILSRTEINKKERCTPASVPPSSPFLVVMGPQWQPPWDSTVKHCLTFLSICGCSSNSHWVSRPMIN